MAPVICTVMVRSRYHAIGQPDGYGRYVEPRDGSEIEIVREPQNPRHVAACAVWWCGHRIGYVPSRVADRLAPPIDAGLFISGRIRLIGGRHVGDRCYDGYALDLSGPAAAAAAAAVKAEAAAAAVVPW